MQITLGVEGLLFLRRLLAPPNPPLYTTAWREGIDELARSTEIAAKFAAPRGKTGRLVAKTRAAVQRGAMPISLKIRSSAQTKGYPYPRLLEFSPKHHHKGWLWGAVEPIWRRPENILQRIAKKIEAIWSG